MISAIIRAIFAIMFLIFIPKDIYKKGQDGIWDRNQTNFAKKNAIVSVIIVLVSGLYITYAEMPGYLNQLHITLEGTIKEFEQTEQGRAIKRYKVTIIDENEKEILLASVETPPEETIEIGDKIEICYYQFRIKPNRPIVKINGIKTEFYGIGDIPVNIRFFTSTSLSIILIWNIINDERRYYKHKKEARDTKKEKELSITRRLGSVLFHLVAFYSLCVPINSVVLGRVFQQGLVILYIFYRVYEFRYIIEVKGFEWNTFERNYFEDINRMEKETETVRFIEMESQDVQKYYKYKARKVKNSGIIKSVFAVLVGFIALKMTYTPSYGVLKWIHSGYIILVLILVIRSYIRTSKTLSTMLEKETNTTGKYIITTAKWNEDIKCFREDGEEFIHRIKLMECLKRTEDYQLVLVHVPAVGKMFAESIEDFNELMNLKEDNVAESQ